MATNLETGGDERPGERAASPKAGHGRIFVNYRRADAPDAAGRLADDLEDHFGPGTVFRDVRITYGDDFLEVMTAAARSCDVFLAVIGSRWATLEKDGIRRIQRPDDYVRMEIQIALERADVKVIPVLVGDIDMPDAAVLPQELSKLSGRNACHLRDRTWRQDLADLIVDVTRALRPDGASPAPRPDRGPDRPPPPAWSTAGKMAAAAAVAGPLGLLASSPLHDQPSGRGADRQPDLTAARERVLSYALERAVIWAVVGAVVLVLWTVLARAGRQPVTAALSGAVAGGIGGLLGGALFQGVKYLANPARGDGAVEISAGPLLRVVSYLIPALLIGWAFARVARGLGRAGGMAAGATAGCIAGLVTYAELPFGRAVSLALEALAVGGLLAVAAVVATRGSGGAAATEASASTARA